MKRTVFAALTTLIATPVLAHDGAHMHPHGFEPMALAAMVLLGLLAGVVMTRK